MKIIRPSFAALLVMPLLCAYSFHRRAPIRLSLHQPAERQVFQRDQRSSGTIHVTGVVHTEGRSTVRLQITCVRPGHPARTLQRREELIDAAQAETRFLADLRVPAGGWYDVVVVARASPGGAAGVLVRRVGVGEVFVTAGQSNSANGGWPRMRPAEDRVSAYDVRSKSWRWAEDPQTPADGDGGSPWPILGDRLVQKLNMPVAFASVGKGCRSVVQWSPERKTFAYERLRTVVTDLGGEVRAVLWHQGETDADTQPGPCSMQGSTSSELYYSTLRSVIIRLDQAAHRHLRWFVANAAYSPGLPTTERQRRQTEAIRSAQRRLWENRLAFRGPDTDTLTSLEYRLPGSAHFNAKGLRAHAEMWYERLLASDLLD